MNKFCLIGALTAGGLIFSSGAHASSSSGGEEYLSVVEGVPPNIIFLVDRSSNMASPCNSSQTESCLTTVLNVIDAVTQHYDWARYALVGTGDSAGSPQFKRYVPLGTPYTQFSAALSGVTTVSSNVSNLAESLGTLMTDYVTNGQTNDLEDDDGDGFVADWNEAAIDYHCQDTHVVVFTNQRPTFDNQVPLFYRPNFSAIYQTLTDIKCDASGLSTADSQCYFDNAVWTMYNFDARSDLTGNQIIKTHTIGINTASNTVANALYANASDLIGGAGIYTSTDGTFDAMLAQVLSIMSSVRSGFYSRSAPVISADGNNLIYTYYEVTNNDPLSKGHIRAYEIDNDPTNTTYGQVLYNGPTEFGGALWDGGTLLVSRIVEASEYNEEDRDGIGHRDIYTFFEPAATVLSSESNFDRRQGLDRTFVSNVGNNSTLLNLILDTSTNNSNPSCPVSKLYDLDEDCNIDDDDLQALIDFARGLPSAQFPFINRERGAWKLGNAPNAIPAVVQSDADLYTLDPTYRKFLDELEQNNYPDIVLYPANDGMLHAFRLYENTNTPDSEIGEELWAWVPGYLLYRTHDATWAGRLMDQMVYGQTFLFDGTPVVEDVWIDTDGDNVKDCVSVPNNCEWKRVVVVQQGKGGPLTLALDITDTMSPKYLWEQIDESDNTAIGYTTSRPVVGSIYDYTDSSNPKDRYVAFWGSGRAVPNATNAAYYKSTEGNVYMWNMGDDYFNTQNAGYQDSSNTGSPAGDNYHPELSVYGSSLNIDSDAQYEYAYISAALAAVDVDSDGDIDTLYFPITTAYKPTSEGGLGLNSITDPGSSWMYKACVSTTSPGTFTWAEFYDPVDTGNLLYRPEVYYSATTAWHSDGSLGVYWGSGSPYDRDSARRGYFFAMKDSAPLSCTNFAVSPVSNCGTNGLYALRPGEGLTAEPVAYAGVVYFPTWTPASDRCSGGTGRLYGLRFDDCSPGLDTDGDGDADSSDSAAISTGSAYPSGITVTDAGTILYGTSAVATDGSSSAVGTVSSATNPFLGTHSIAWMEVF
ncbi:MAG: hypothetical protein VXZ96_05125 [Myxococcota bacterium]|nr:hypothetical protein [Myxococcota bacterium]MEC8379677.1 hypothetical protein [Myxococcota bacterium]